MLKKLRTPDTGARATSQPWSNHLSQAGMMLIESLLFVAVHRLVCLFVCLFVRSASKSVRSEPQFRKNHNAALWSVEDSEKD